MKKILVTGVAGFIASHIVDQLLTLGYAVVGIDNFSTGKQETIDYLNTHEQAKNFTFIEGDIRDKAFCRQICKNIDGINHQAALGSVPRSIKEPQLYVENNVGGTINLLEGARLNGVKRFVYASSSSVYGDTPTLPKVETMPLNPKSPYGLSKAVNEQYAKMYQTIYGLETIGFRYFNVFGPRQDPKSQYAAVIPKFFDQCFSEQAITINGDGKQTRDFTYVDNVVFYNIKALETDSTATGKVYNSGCEKQCSILDLAESIKTLTEKKEVGLTFCESRQGDVKDSLACTKLAEKYLNIDTKISLQEGLEATYKWYKSQLNRNSQVSSSARI
ncbi:MAG: SDR family oxidoreductase [bacterium]